MTAAQVLAAVAALVAAAGVALMIAAATGWQPRTRVAAATGTDWSWASMRWPIALGVALTVWAFTGWPALGMGAAAAAIGLPAMSGAG